MYNRQMAIISKAENNIKPSKHQSASVQHQNRLTKGRLAKGTQRVLKGYSQRVEMVVSDTKSEARMILFQCGQCQVHRHTASSRGLALGVPLAVAVVCTVVVHIVQLTAELVLSQTHLPTGVGVLQSLAPHTHGRIHTAGAAAEKKAHGVPARQRSDHSLRAAHDSPPHAHQAKGVELVSWAEHEGRRVVAAPTPIPPTV